MKTRLIKEESYSNLGCGVLLFATNSFQYSREGYSYWYHNRRLLALLLN